MAKGHDPGMTTQPAAPTATATATESEAATSLLRMIWGIHISRAVYLAAELGIADLLSDGPVDSAELARATGTHAPSLYRVLRLLAALHVLDEVEPRTFANTVLGERLRTGAPAGLRSWATFLDVIGATRAFEYIADTVRTGRPAFEAATGRELFASLAENPSAAAAFDAAMSERTAAFAPSVARGYDFTDLRTVVDVGGGQGTLLVEILAANRHLHGVLFETPEVAARADALLDAIDLRGRCEVKSGDFFEGVPDGADCYLLANVLHDWDDDAAVTILANCRRSMAGNGRVLILERLIPEKEQGGDPIPALLSDINMLVITGGRERTNAEYTELLHVAGLTIGGVQPVAFPYGVIEGSP
jgi:orsellinic acid C2-O-methyltransferase